MKKVEELGISPAPWCVRYDEGMPYRIDCTRKKGFSNRVVDDFDGILNSDASLIAAAPELYECLHEAVIRKCSCCTTDDDGGCDFEECFVNKWRKVLEKAGGEG